MRKKHAQERLWQRFDEAEAQNLCVIPQDENERRQIFTLKQKGLVVAPLPGLAIRRSYWEGLEGHPNQRALCLAQSLGCLRPGTIFCLYTAALLHGLWVSGDLLKEVHVLATERTHTHRQGGLVYRPGHCKHPVRHQGCNATPFDQTLFECLLKAPFPEALAIADSALRIHSIDKAGYLEKLGRYSLRRKGRKKALRALELADAAAENGGESIVRGLIIVKGFVPPTDLQPEFRDPLDPCRKIRPDLHWKLEHGGKTFELFGEIDGYAKYVDTELIGSKSTAEVLVAERQRESHITALGVPVMRILFRNIRKPGYLENILESYGVPRV